MSWIDANAQVLVYPNGTRAQMPQAPGTGQAQVNSFLTPTSLVTFGGASTAVIVIWQVLGAVHAPWKDEKAVPLVLSFLIGIIIYVVSDDQGKGWKQIVARIAVGIINCFFLAAAALGITSVTK
ncbi:MAG TPA: hypothetical protein VKD90_20955 [Gemmataceae bacterium]|nr:hypothetical protein [Gemmataceae bacterium]